MISNILNEFVQECSKKLNVINITQFGSSTYLDNPNDIDLLVVSKDIIFSFEDYKKLFEIVKAFEKKYPVSFDMSTPQSAKSKYKITIVPLQQIDFIYQIDKFFLRFLQKDKHRKLLFGKDQLDITIKISKRELIERLSMEMNRYVRLGVEKRSQKDFNEFINYFFKSILRIMLVNEEVYKKEDLLNIFQKKYSSIKLPRNSINILKHKIHKEDFNDVLKFANNCINYIHKEKEMK